MTLVNCFKKELTQFLHVNSAIIYSFNTKNMYSYT